MIALGFIGAFAFGFVLALALARLERGMDVRAAARGRRSGFERDVQRARWRAARRDVAAFAGQGARWAEAVEALDGAQPGAARGFGAVSRDAAGRMVGLRSGSSRTGRRP